MMGLVAILAGLMIVLAFVLLLFIPGFGILAAILLGIGVIAGIAGFMSSGSRRAARYERRDGADTGAAGTEQRHHRRRAR